MAVTLDPNNGNITATGRVTGKEIDAPSVAAYRVGDKNLVASTVDENDTRPVSLRAICAWVKNLIGGGIKVPTKTSDLENDGEPGGEGRPFLSNPSLFDPAGAATVAMATEKLRAEAAEKALDDKITAINNWEVKMVDVLPETGEKNIIYLVPSATSAFHNFKDEFIWVNSAWEQIGSTVIDISGKRDKTDLTVYDAKAWNLLEVEAKVAPKNAEHYTIEVMGPQKVLDVDWNEWYVYVMDGEAIACVVQESFASYQEANAATELTLSQGSPDYAALNDFKLKRNLEGTDRIAKVSDIPSKLSELEIDIHTVSEDTIAGWGFLKKAWSDLVNAFAGKTHKHTKSDITDFPAIPATGADIPVSPTNAEKIDEALNLRLPLTEAQVYGKEKYFTLGSSVAAQLQISQDVETGGITSFGITVNNNGDAIAFGYKDEDGNFTNVRIRQVISDKDLNPLCTACGISLTKPDGKSKTRAEKLLELFSVSNSNLLQIINNIIGYPTYEKKAYAVGDIVEHEGVIYKCKTAITTVEDWTEAHWEKSNVKSQIPAVVAPASDMALKNKAADAYETGVKLNGKFDVSTDPTADGIHAEATVTIGGLLIDIYGEGSIGRGSINIPFGKSGDIAYASQLSGITTQDIADFLTKYKGTQYDYNSFHFDCNSGDWFYVDVQGESNSWVANRRIEAGEDWDLGSVYDTSSGLKRLIDLFGSDNEYLKAALFTDTAFIEAVKKYGVPQYKKDENGEWYQEVEI